MIDRPGIRLTLKGGEKNILFFDADQNAMSAPRAKGKIKNLFFRPEVSNFPLMGLDSSIHSCAV